MAVTFDWSAQPVDTRRQPEFDAWDMRDEILCRRRPALFVQGRDDPYSCEGQPASAALLPRTEIAWLEDCAHSPQLEQSARVLALLQAFIAKVVTDER